MRYLLARAKDNDLAELATSGGFTRCFIAHLLQTKRIDTACLVRAGNADTNLKPEVVAVSDPDEFLYSRRFNSTYHFINPLPTLRGLEGKVAATLLPCQVQRMEFQIECTIELLCGLTPNQQWHTKLLEWLHIQPEQVEELTHRHTWPAQVVAKNKNGQLHTLELPWPHRAQDMVYVNEFCKPCTLHEVGGDLIVGDPWCLPSDGKRGRTIVCVRNDKWNSVIDEMTTIDLEEMSANQWGTCLDNHTSGKDRKRMYGVGSCAR